MQHAFNHIGGAAIHKVFIFFRIDTIEEELFRHQDETNNILRAIADDLRVVADDHRGKEND